MGRSWENKKQIDEKEEKVVVFSGTIRNFISPRAGNTKDGQWVSFGLKLTKSKDKIHITKYGTVSCNGCCPILKKDTVYKIRAIESFDETYGYSYKIDLIGVDVTALSKSEQKQYLLSAIGESKTELLYSNLSDPIKVLEDEDIETLCKIKGIRENSAKQLIKKYNGDLGYAEAISLLKKYDMTDNQIKGLVDRFGSGQTIDNKIKKNPYFLLNAKGYGWEKTDKIARASGIKPYDKRRIEAYVGYFLQSQADVGNIWMYQDQLWEGLCEKLGGNLDDEIVGNIIHDLEERGNIFFTEDRERMAWKKYYKMEVNTAKELVRLAKCKNTFKYNNWREKVAELEKEQGWNYTEEQLKGIYSVLENQVTVVVGSAGCVDCDTEFFNGTQWKRIADYKKEDKVLQYNKDGSTNLTYPIRYIKLPCEKMWNFKTSRIDQCLSDDHLLLYLNRNDKLSTMLMKDFVEKQNKNKHGFQERFITSFIYDGAISEYTDDELRFIVAFQADGKFISNNTIGFHFHKDRKKDRIINLLNKMNITYKYSYDEKEKHTIYIKTTPNLKNICLKEFPNNFVNYSFKQKQVIIDELKHWDSNIINDNLFVYYSNNLKNIQIIQFVVHSINKRGIIGIDDRVGCFKNNSNHKYKNINYRLNISNRNTCRLTIDSKKTNKTKIEEYKTKDGYKYCFSVPSEMLVLRRNKKIFVTHNCGKTSLVTGMLKALEGNNYIVAQCALSGKASANLTDVTGEEGYTIHRLLGVNTDEESDNRFLHNKKNPLNSDVVILDELSMVNIDILYSLIQSIKDGAKLIMLGDIKQLETIGMGNALHDIMLSNTINVVELTKIHRQASASGIITESLKASDKQTWIDRNFFGKKVVGELKDMEYDIIADRRDIVDTIMEYYKEFIEKGISPEDIMILTPKKEEGDTSAWNLSNIVQDYLVKNQKEKHLQGRPKSKYSELYYENDLVMNTVNDYRKVKAIGNNKEGYIPDKESCIPIFNGDMGKVVYIDEDLQYMVVKFNNKNDLVYIPKQDLSAMRLAYSATTNKMQGSSRPYVICAIDYSHYMLLTKEMIYTMLTRAKKYCVMVAENSAYLYAIKHSNISKKQTFLKEELQKYWFNYEELKREIKPTIYIED